MTPPPPEVPPEKNSESFRGRFTKRQTLAFLTRLDDRHAREGYQRKFRLYCTGGTKMVLSGLRESSVDVDFMLSQEDFRSLSAYAAEIDRQGEFRFDLFPAGRMPGYRFPGFADRAKPAPYAFRHLDLFLIDDVDFVVTKALAGRGKDREDLRILLAARNIPKERVLERYQAVQFDPDQERDLRTKFEHFLTEFYGSTA